MKQKAFLKRGMVTTALLLILSSSASVSAFEPAKMKNIYSQPVYPSYTFSNVGGKSKLVSSPSAYLPRFYVDSEVLGLEMKKPSDLFCASTGDFYIVDSVLNRIIQTDSLFNVKKVIDSFASNGKTETFSDPEGIYVTDKAMYIADTGNSRIVVLDQNGASTLIIERPKSEILAEDFKFKPIKVAVDSSDRIYAIGQGAFEGLMEFFPDGRFSGFVGSIPVKADPLLLFWKSIYSQTQKAKVQQFIPVDFTNISMDSEGFLYTVSLSSSNEEPIRRLNPAGKDILIRKSLTGTRIAGDVIIDSGSSTGTAVATTSNKSAFVDICDNGKGIYYALDLKKGRIFTYDYDGNLLFVFGGPNSGQIGTFGNPSAIEYHNNNLYVMDSKNASITIFTPTDYALKVLDGLYLYKKSDYDNSVKAWQDVLKYNSNFELAYSKIGAVLFRQEKYEEAMTNFKLSNDQANYSKAMFYLRRDFLRINFGLMMSILSILIAAIVLTVRIYRKKRGKKEAEAIETGY